MREAQSTATPTGENLERLFALLEAARAEQTSRQLFGLRTACRALLAAIENQDQLDRAA